jgi:hypothetical protein
VEARRLTLALESAIERVETIYSKYDEQRALESLDRLIESSEIDAREVLIEPREPLLIVNQAPRPIRHRPRAICRLSRLKRRC